MTDPRPTDSVRIDIPHCYIMHTVRLIHLDVQRGTLGGWYRCLHGEKWDLDIRVRLLFKFKEIPKK